MGIKSHLRSSKKYDIIHKNQQYIEYLNVKGSVLIVDIQIFRQIIGYDCIRKAEFKDELGSYKSNTLKFCNQRIKPSYYFRSDYQALKMNWVKITKRILYFYKIKSRK